MRAALEALPPSVLRVKGFCQLGAEGVWHLLQYAAERWAFTKLAAPAEAGFVIIGTPDMPDAAAMGARFTAAVLARESAR